MNTREFLQQVITTPEGYFCLALGPNASYGWREVWYHWPEDIDRIVEAALAAAPNHNVYFSSYLFSTKNSQKIYVLPSRTIQADLDAADLYKAPIAPSVLIRTSPGRHQGYWFISEALPPDTHEVLSRKITYSIPGCDRSGWPLGRKVRLPGTLNHKYPEGPHPVAFDGTGATLKTSSPNDLELLEDAADSIDFEADDKFLSEPPSLDIGPRELLASVKDKMPATVITTYGNKAQDRSKALWALACAGFRAGLERDEVFWLCKNSANNKFTELLYHGDRELAKDVLRAEQVVRSRIPDVRSQITDARLLEGPVILKRQQLEAIVVGHLKQMGTFIKTDDERAWYIRSDIGRPIMISHHSETLNTLLDRQFSLNSSETDQRFVVHGLTAFGANLPTTGQVGSMSFYDIHSNTMLLHTGQKEVIHITPATISRLTNGAYGVVFPWLTDGKSFSPTLDPARRNDLGSQHWSDILFDGFLGNIVNMKREEAHALLTVWLLFVLFRAAAESKPLLALFGQPGGGKSTLGKCMYELLFGTHELEAITDEEDYDQAMISRPLAIYDGVDSWEKWFPDRFSQSASSTKLRRRKLYTDADEFFATRQAMVGVTAHNPHFGREDIYDRMVVFLFQRLDNHFDETEIISRITRYRNVLWGGIVADIQKILNTPKPDHKDIPQFRIADFAYLGKWIASGLGPAVEQAFVSGLPNMVTEQKVFTLEDDHILVECLKKLVEKQAASGISLGSPEAWRTPAAIWSICEMYAGDETQAFQRRYRNAVTLGKKLWIMHDVLKSLFFIETRFDTTRGSRVWRIFPLEFALLPQGADNVRNP